MTDTPFALDSPPEFIGQSRADWLYQVKKALNKTTRDRASIESLTSVTPDGITRGPLTTLNDRAVAPPAIVNASPPHLNGRPWHICAPVRDPERGFANSQLVADLTGGASAARITLGDNGTKTEGVAITRAADITHLFEGVHTDLIPISFRGASSAQIEAIFDTPNLRGAAVTLGLDIFEPEIDLPAVIKRCPENWRALTLRADRVYEDGGTDAQELAVMAASVVHAMRTLGPELASKHLSIEIAIGCDTHMSIAKIRAARRLYARIAESFGLSNRQVPLYTISALRMMQSTDPWTNMLRVMSAGVGAALGGADYITLRPFTDKVGPDKLGMATPFGYRTARGLQLLMMEESRLGQVSDPAHGSYFHEHMTDALAQSAWAKFQAIEALGGATAYHASVQYKADISASVKARTERAEPIVGVTLHKADSLRAAKVRGPLS